MSEEEIEIIEGQTTNDAIRLISNCQKGRRNFDDIFFVCDLGDIAKTYQKWTELFPGIRPFFAIKASPYATMIQCLSALGAGYDCASQKEIDLALSNGASPDSIIFANTSKSVSHILHAKEKGVKLLVFDSQPELYKMKEHYPESDLVLRIKTDDSTSTHKLSSKFGATVEECKFLLQISKQLQLRVVGISFHVGGGCNDASLYTKAIRDARQLFDYAEKLNMEFNILDIGGGFRAMLGSRVTIEEIATVVNASLEKYFSCEEFQNLKVIAEPGRYFAATAFTLATNVITKREPTQLPDVEAEYTINDGCHGCFSLRFQYPGEWIPFVPEKFANEDRHYALLWGPTCDSIAVYEKISVPKLEIGDWLFWKDTGAYSFAIASNFNGFKAETFYNIISLENEKVFWSLVGGKDFGRRMKRFELHINGH